MTGEELTPRTALRLIGHEAAEAALLDGLARGRLAHGWIFAGPRGIGKATLAYRFARALLAGEHPDDVGPDHPVFRRVAALSHSDLLVVEPLYDRKKEEYARDINAGQAREIAQFLALTPGEGQWRAVIIDSADVLNSHAANAILKILEEPPKRTVLMLISHNPGRLLPTIRSRCRMLRLAPLSSDAFTAVLREHAPGMDGAELKALAQFSHYAPGLALELHGEGAFAMFQDLIALLTLLPNINTLKNQSFSDSLSAGEIHARWQLLTRLMLFLLERAGKQAAGSPVAPVSPEEGTLLHSLARLHPAGVWAGKWQQCAEQFSLAERLHLDYKQVIISFIHSLAAVEPYQIGAAA